MTLLELMFAVAILGIITAGIAKAMNDLGRTSRARKMNAAKQGEGRDALQVVVRDLKVSSQEW